MPPTCEHAEVPPGLTVRVIGALVQSRRGLVEATALSTSLSETAIPDVIATQVLVGARVLVVSELHLTREVTPALSQASTELARAIDAWTGPGVLIFNGSTLDLLTPDAVAGRLADPRAALTAHPKLLATVVAFAEGPGRQVVYLPGSRDSQAAWDPKTAAVIREQLHAELALAAELTIDTGAGPRLVRVEPGHRLDPLTRLTDPRNPADTPLGQHLVCEILPALRDAGTKRTGGEGWLAGLEALDDPASFPRFLASRLAYRRVGRHAWWLLLPVLAAVLLRLPIAVLRSAHHHVDSASRIVLFIGLGTVLDVLLVALVAAVLVRRTWRALAGVALSRSSDRLDRNEGARALARQLVTAGDTGLITGHTRHPELTNLGTGFYANAGGASEVVSETPSRLSSLGMPSLFLAHRQVSWVELEAGNELHVRLLHAGQVIPGATIIERLIAAPTGVDTTARELHPAIVASWPQGESWPAVADDGPRLRRVRRWSAGLVATAGVISLVSSFYQPARGRLAFLLRLIPLAVPQVADALVALGSLGLLLLARSVRRGQRRAWVVCEVLLVTTAIGHLVKGVDVEEALVAIAVALYLFYHRSAFAASVDQPSARRGLSTLAAGAVCCGPRRAPSAPSSAPCSAGPPTTAGCLCRERSPPSSERLIGLHSVRLPDRVDDFFVPAMMAVSLTLVLAAAYLFFRPVVARRGAAAALDGLAKARDIVRRHGAGTLDYFALRGDKQFFFWGASLVAYGVYGGVCLVSPDPIGPVAEREEVWKAFRRFADDQGWTLAVLGAGEDWLPTYRTSGMHDLYVGDEAVVDVTRFTLEGGRYKGLRQAVNRIAKYGYTISFHDPASLPLELRTALEAVMTKSRRGDVERGFSMTLGRAFDPSDEGLLLAVVHNPDGDPVAFIQYVPAAGIDGYSLDLMRRDDGEHPNGLIDFAIVETIKYLRANSRHGLGLNFATMRAVLAGEAGEGLTQRVQAWLLRRMSDSMQIESLWKFNAKYDPLWQPRYALYDSPEHALPFAVAVARAESFWELPVIGRFLSPSAARVETAAGRGNDPTRPVESDPVPTPRG